MSCNQKTDFPEVYGIVYTQIQFQKVEAVRLCLRASKPPEVVIPFIIRDDGPFTFHWEESYEI